MGFFNSISLAVRRGGKFNDLVKQIVSSCPNSADSDHVQIAAESKNFHMVEYLVTHGGASPNYADSQGKTSLMTVCTVEDEYKTVDVLLTAGADIAKRDDDKMTALMYASQQGHMYTVATLLQR